MSLRRARFTPNEDRKPVGTKMYWWLNNSRPFYIGDEYRIDLIKINDHKSSVKIVVTNLKNCKDEYPKPEDLKNQSKEDWELFSLFK